MQSLFRSVLYLQLLFFINSCNMIENENLKIDLIDSKIEMSNDRSLPIEDRKNHLENANDLINSLPETKIKIKKSLEISVDYYYLNNFRKYKELSEKALELSKMISDSLNIAKSYVYLALYYKSKQPEIAYKNFYEAEKIYSFFEKNDKRAPSEYAYDHGKVLLDLALIKRKTKDYFESEALTIRAIEKFNLSERKKHFSLCYTNLGIIAKYLERYDESISYHRKAIRYQKGTDQETRQTLISLNNIGTVLKSQKKYHEAKKIYSKALSYTEFLSKDLRRLSLLKDNLAYVNFLSNDLSEIPDLFFETLDVRDSIGDKNGLTTNYLHLSEYYQFIEEDSISRIYAQKSKKISHELQNNDELLKSYQILSEVSSGNEATKYAHEYIKLNDSLVKEERLFRDKLARIQYETEKKEQQIIKVQNQNTIYLLGMLLLLSGIGFSIYFFRQRTRHLAQQNKIVQFQASYEAETRISKRLHDELGNDIFQVMLQYDNDPHDPRIKEKLNTSYIKARDISRENNEFETGESFSEELNNMLQNYTQNGIQLMARGLDRIDWDDISKPIKITVYRVLQELMTNMQKHSKADLVVLVFTYLDNRLRIKYSDNGVGVTKEHLQSKNGLRNTEKRIQAIQGTLIFESEKDKGFKAEIKIPN